MLNVNTLSLGKCVVTDVVAVTGCIRPEKLDRLNPRDAGGQYDSAGGAGGHGNPQGSVCLGYVRRYTSDTVIDNM